MTPKGAIDIEGSGGKTFGDALNLRRRDEQKDGGRIDETTDQPGTGDPINLWARARDPYGAPQCVARRQISLWHERPVRLRPGDMSSDQHLG
ncbi:MAG: hypothetical protein FD139_3607 [Methylocystaceae bacterium]|nr:MAG: hypothetical protein FD172_3499 [Methylocystaceae bacterium]TXT42435.1 MAG: hypothetical protein FD139_3607 [Methylocystaceae bacterium]